MTTDVSVTSQALLLLRANTISSFSDDSNEAEIANVMYREHIVSLLSIHPWTFATKKIQLSRDSVSPIGEYTYSYVVPSDVLLIWAAFNTDDIGSVPIRDYDIYGTDTARRIYTNHTALYIDYTFYPSEVMWPGYFTQFAIHSLAAYLAIPVTGNADLAAHYHQVAYGTANSNRKGGLYGVATATDSKQKRNEFIVSSPITTARFS